MGGPAHELCELQPDTGAVEVVYKVAELNGNEVAAAAPGSLMKNDLPTIPEFFRETNFRDAKMGTLKRDTNLRMFDRSQQFIRASHP